MHSLLSRKFSLSSIAALVAAVLLPIAAMGQTKALITGKIDPNSRASLTRSIPARVLKATDLGRVSSSLPMRDMLLMLQPSDAQKKSLETFLVDVQNPSSANYHKFLSPTEYGMTYGPAQADLNTITAWLTSQGFKVESVAAAHNWIRFSGTAGAVETTFGTQIHNYESDGVKRISNATELSIPEALSEVVSGVLSVNNFEKRSFHTPAANVTRNSAGKMMRAAQSTTAPQQLSSVDGTPVPEFTSQGQPEQTLLAPGDFAKIYNTSSLVAGGNNGSGVSIAIVGRSDISLSDVETFRTLFKLPYNDPTIINANADPGVVVGDDEEAILDVEWSGAVAPMAQIKYVIGGTTETTDGVDISAAYIVDNKLAPVMSLSFGECEQLLAQTELTFYNSLWQQAAAEGISVIVSAGDNGASGCLNQNEYLATNLGFGVSGLASTPYNTAVGGTEFNDPVPDTYWSETINADQSSAKGYIPEYVWNETCNTLAPTTLFNCYFQQAESAPAFAGSGGASTCSTHNSSASILTGLYTCTSGYTKPSWQTGTGVPADGERDIPDVSLAAAGGHDGFLICYDGSCQYTTNADGSFSLEQATVIGGTSAAAPSMAAILALVEQKNGQYQGLANYKLYSLANAQTGNCNSSSETDPTQSNSCVFHDVTEGSNSMTCTGTLSGCTIPIAGTTYKQLSGWSAGAGYDLATGLGSLNVANLVVAWGDATQTATTTSLTLSTTTFTHGTSVTVGSTVTPVSGTGVPSGSLALVATGATSSPGPVQANTLTAGAYSGSVTNLPGGTYAVTASYGGDASYSGSTSSPVNVTVAPELSVMTASTLALSRFFILGRQPIVTATSAALGSEWFISISMAGNSGAGIPTGTIAITQGTANVGTFTLDKTGAIYITCGPGTPCDFPVGSYTFTATYSGDSSFNKTNSTFPFTITKGTANWAVAANQQIVTTGTPVTATVYIIYDPAVLPTGTVTLIRTDTNAVLGTGTVNSSGNAVIMFNAPTGSYGASATWTGDANYTAGYVSSYPDMTVTAPVGITTTSALKTSGATSSLGQRTSFSVTITPSSKPTNGVVPTGTVTLYSQEEGQIAAAVPIVGGNATLFVQWPIAGTETVYGVYSGDSNYAASNTSQSVVTVSEATPILSLSSLAPYVLTGGRDSITATLSSAIASTSAAAPTGTIQFYDSLNGAAAVAVGNSQAINTGNGNTILATVAPMLAAGTHVITAVYSGDTNWTTATSAASLSIVSTSADFSITGPSGVAITAGQSATVALNTTSILGFATPAAISCGGTLPEGVVCGTTTITPGSAGSLSLASVAPGTVNVGMNNRQKSFPWQAPSAVAMASLLFFCLPRRRRLVSLASLLLITLITAFGISGCAGGSSPITSELSVTSANSKVASGTSVSLNAQVSGGKNPTGTVTFYDGNTSIGASSLSNSIGNLDISTLAVGTHSITASYSGDNNNAASKSSDVLNQTVTGTFSLTITASAGTLSHTAVVPVTLQ